MAGRLRALVAAAVVVSASSAELVAASGEALQVTDDSCVTVRRELNSSTRPWTYWWSSLELMGNATCATVHCNKKLQDEGAAELARGLETAVRLKVLRLNWAGIIEVQWDGAGMNSIRAALRALPLEEASLMTDGRETMPGDAVATLVSNMPKLTSLTMKLGSSKVTDDSVAALMVALPATLESLDLDLRNNPFSSNVATALSEGLDRGSSLKHVSVNLMSCRAISNEGKIAIFQALKAGEFEECSLSCEAIKDLNSTLASEACVGSGNCKMLTTPAPPNDKPPAAPGTGGWSRELLFAVITTSLVLAASLLGCLATRTLFRRSESEVRRPVLSTSNLDKEFEFGYVPPERFGDRKDD